MVYTTMYSFCSKDDIEIDEHIRKEIQETLNEAVEFFSILHQFPFDL